MSTINDVIRQTMSQTRTEAKQIMDVAQNIAQDMHAGKTMDYYQYCQCPTCSALRGDDRAKARRDEWLTEFDRLLRNAMPIADTEELRAHARKRPA